MADKNSSSSGSENGDSRNSSRSSASEEERLRRLFNSCDADGDGFLDGEDFTFMCRMLNMADSVDEIRHQLGMTNLSKMSFDDFMQCRSRVMLESSLHQEHHMTQQNLPTMTSPSPAILSTGEDTGIESDASGIACHAPKPLTSWPTLSSDSLGALSCNKPESADYDSGARDLSPEPAALSLTQLLETHEPHALKELLEFGGTYCLEVANRLHQATLTSLKGEIVELKTQVSGLVTDRRMAQSQCQHAKESVDQKLTGPDLEERLELLTNRYEERIIELHSVIAELRKKVERHQINIIHEEDEFEESDQAQSIQSNDGESFAGKDDNNEISQEFSRVVSEIETDLASRSHLPVEGDIVPVPARMTQSGTVGEEQEAEGLEKDSKTGLKSETSQDDVPPQLPPRATRPCTLPHLPQADRQENARLGSEVTELKADNEELRRQTTQLQVELGQMTEQMYSVVDEKDGLKKKVTELQEKLRNASMPASPTHSRISTPTKQIPMTHPIPESRSCDLDNVPVAKMAELKKLKTCVSDMHILGSEVAIMGVESTTTAEHLVQSVQGGSNIAELLQMKSSGQTGNKSNAMVSEFELELERRQAKIDHLKAQNDVLTATLDESKSQAERLSVLIGKYESNHTALQLASAFTDHCLEAQDMLIALLDTEMGVLLANCRAAGLGGLGYVYHDENEEEVTTILQRAHHARRRTEGVARHLLSRLDRNSNVHSTSSSGMCQPWEDVSTNSRTDSTSSTASSSDIDFTKLEETKLKDHIQQLKVDRSAVRMTVLELESVHVDPIMSGPRRKTEAQRLDLENAVLVQELMALKEEKAELKARSYLLEKEKRALELRLSGKETQEQAFRMQIDHLKGELTFQKEEIEHCLASSSMRPSLLSSVSFPQGKQQSLAVELASENPSELAQSLNLSLEREVTLKKRVSELMTTLEKISRNSESRHKQSAEFVNDLKRANSALITAFDKAKKKYQGRLKKMETQLKGVKDKYDRETASLHHRISLMENHGVQTRPLPSETSL